MENNNSIEIACNIADSCLDSLKSIIHAPLFYTEVLEDGSTNKSTTDFGSQIYDIIYEISKKNIDKINKL